MTERNPRLDVLAAAAIHAYRDRCAHEGIDPEREIAEIRLDDGVPSHVWMALRLAGLNRRPPRPANDIIRIVENPDRDPHATALILLDADGPTREIVARKIVAPGIVRALAWDQDRFVLEALAENPNLPGDVLVDFAHHECGVYRMAIASHPRLPANLLAKLAGDKLAHVRAAAARNARLDTVTLLRLAQDRESIVRAAVAASPTASQVVLSLLHAAAHPHVDAALAANPRASSDLLWDLHQTGGHTVRTRAGQQLKARGLR